MNALNIYLSACRYVVQIEPDKKESWQDLYRYLPYLRQALTCCVCGGLLRHPTSPVNVKSCQHHVCKQCIGGKMRVRPSCSWCKEWDQFVENTQLRILLQCFKEICHHLAGSEIYNELTTSLLGEKFKLSAIISDGMNIEEYKYSAKNKFDNISNWPLPHFTFLSTSCQTNSIGPITEISPKPTDVKHDEESEDRMPKCNSTEEISSPVSVPEVAKSFVHKTRRFSGSDISQRLHKPELDMQTAVSRKVRYPSQADAGEQTVNSELCAVNSVENTQNDTSTCKRPQVPTTAKRPKVDSEPTRKGCRCGTANVPNKLTCYCQRCPCYSLRLGCFGCKCRGCRNPYNKRKAPDQVDSSPGQEVNVET